MELESSMNRIEISDLSKTYGRHQALNRLNLVLDTGVINFIIGANGSGKTTLLKSILQIIKYKGRIAGVERSIAYLPEGLLAPDYVRVQDYLVLIGKVRGMDKNEIASKLRYYFDKFSMSEHLNKYLIHLSKGTKQKVMLIQALMTDVDIYVFDEPLSGLDKDSQEVFFSELRLLLKSNKMIIISTHNLKTYRFRKKRVINLEDYFNQNEFIESSSEVSPS